MKTVNMHQAKTHLSRLVQEIKDGTVPEVVIAVGGKPAARLVPVGPPPRRALGADQGLIAIAEDFDQADDEITTLFESSET